MNRYLCFISTLLIIAACGEDGLDGIDGEPGAQGFNALLELTDLPVGNADCANGGTLIETGVDNGDGGGIAGNNALEPGEIDAFAIICDGIDLNAQSFEFFFDDTHPHLNSAVISDRYLNSNKTDEIEMGFFIDESIDSVSRVRTLIRFDSIAKIIQPIVEGNSKVKEASLFFWNVGTILQPTFKSPQIIPFGLRTYTAVTSAPLGLEPEQDYNINEVTWIAANDGLNWPTPGILKENLDFEDLDDKEIIFNQGDNINTDYVFGLDTAVVNDWVMDDASNRGMIMAYDEQFIAHHSDVFDIKTTSSLSMILYIRIEIDGSVGSGRSASANASADEFGPLYKYWRYKK